jgi:hypothetical protein
MARRLIFKLNCSTRKLPREPLRDFRRRIYLNRRDKILFAGGLISRSHDRAARQPPLSITLSAMPADRAKDLYREGAQ